MEDAFGAAKEAPAARAAASARTPAVTDSARGAPRKRFLHFLFIVSASVVWFDGDSSVRRRRVT